MAIYPVKPFVDKGISVGPEVHILNDPSDSGYTVKSGYKAFVLANRARDQQTLADGTEVAGSLSVSNGGQYFTEVFSLPVPAGAYFYNQDDDIAETSTLLFNLTTPDLLPITVYYETRGNKVKASFFNVYNYGSSVVPAGGSFTVTHTYPTTPTTPLSGIIVVASADNGSLVSYTVNTSLKQVNITGTPGATVSFMLIAIPTI